MKKLYCLVSLVLGIAVFSADLNISGQSGKTFDGGTYSRLIIRNSDNIVVKNCQFSASSGAVGTIGGSDHITVENCDFDGQVNACTGMNVESGCSHIVITRSGFHDIADDGLQMWSSSDIEFSYNKIWALYGCGTDGGCGPCYNGHSDGIELDQISRAQFIGNLIWDVRSTSAFFFGNYSGNYCSDIVMADNIFYTPESGFVTYIAWVKGIKIYNNIFWKGVYGGLQLALEVTGLECYNNICHSINLNHSHTTYNPSQHHLDYNLIAVTGQGLALQPHDVYDPNYAFQKIPAISSSTKYRMVIVDDFLPLPGSGGFEAGTSLVDIPAEDIVGTVRSNPPDLGPFENGAGASTAERSGPASFGDFLAVSPNPIRSSMNIRFLRDDVLNVEIYDIRGKRIKTFDRLERGCVKWHAAARPNGAYLIKIQTSNGQYTKRVLLLK